MSKKIELPKEKFAIVDDDMYEYLNQWKWYVYKGGKTFYAIRNDGIFPFKKTIRMHRVIMNTPEGMEVDHKDGNGLHNTRSNLRNCTHAQNKQNIERHSDKKTEYKGVYPLQGKWRAGIRVDGKLISLGYFDIPEDAAHAYDEAAKKYFGEFARTNF